MIEFNVKLNTPTPLDDEIKAHVVYVVTSAFRERGYPTATITFPEGAQ